MHNTQENGLHVLYKVIGETPNEAILKFKSNNPEYKDVSMTYAGRLDPMAEGLLLVLSGEEIKNKDKYLNLDKTYEAQILWGFQTDTLDILGIVESHKVFKVDENELKDKIKNSIGLLKQNYPAYSSKPVNGKPLFQWAREGRIGEIEIPTHMVEIFDATFVERRTIHKEELLVNIKFKIESVNGDFRQEEIWKKWLLELTSIKEEEFVIDTINIKASSGFYVRQFISDLAKSLGEIATTFHIKRLSIGEYCIK